MKRIILMCFLAGMVLSCKPSKKDLIVKKWQATNIESPSLKQELEQQRNFLDTIGTTTSPDANEMLYGIRNMDSMRHVMRAQFDSFLVMQQQTIQNTWLDFHKDGTVIASFGSDPDTISWYFDDGGDLILDELKQKGAGSKIRMEVISLKPEELQLRYNENGFSSTASFKPALK